MATPKRYMIVDGSYFVFYRFFAVANWFKLHNPESVVPTERLFESPEFMKTYDKLFGQSLTKLMKRHGIEKKEHVLFVEDCPRSSIWRGKSFSEYKMSRKPSAVDPKIFHHSLQTLAQELGINVIGCPNAEADDVAYVVCMEMVKDGAMVTVITNDNDYLQVFDKDRIHVFNVQGLDLSTRMMGFSAKDYLTYKILVGDKSDNIPSAIPRVGPKKALDLVNNPEKLESLLQSNPCYRARFDENNMLMNFEMMPEEIRKRASDAYIKRKMNVSTI
jgi:5'-3' exonuclease